MTEQEFLSYIRTYRGLIYKVCRIYFEDKDDRDDLFQEIILQTWKSLSSFQGNCQFSTWLYRIAINTAIVHFKREKKRSVFDGEEMAEQLSDDTSMNIQLDHFYKAVYQLDKIEKAIVLQYIDGLSGEEIGKNLGISAVNTRVKLNRTKLKLQQIIKKQGYEF